MLINLRLWLSVFVLQFVVMKSPHTTMSILETKAMMVLWKQRTCCVHMVQMELAGQKKMAYTTVQTIMERLVAKGMAKKHQVDKTAVYTPAVTKSAYAASLTISLIQQLSSDYDDSMITALAKGLALLDKKQRRQLIQNLDSSGNK